MKISYTTKRAMVSWRRLQREAEQARKPRLMMFVPHPMYGNRGEWVSWADAVAEQMEIARRYG